MWIKEEDKEQIELVQKLFAPHRLVSLGFSCYPKMFISTIREQPTQFFDWNGIPAWSLRKLFQMGLSINEMFDIGQIMFYTLNDTHANIITHKNLFIRYLHDFPDDKVRSVLELDEDDEIKYTEETIKKLWKSKLVRDIRDRYKRRRARMIKMFNHIGKTSSGDGIVFIYQEENTENRFETLYDEIREYYPAEAENYEVEKSRMERLEIRKLMQFIQKKYTRLRRQD
jgi:hypothetical protein